MGSSLAVAGIGALIGGVVLGWLGIALNNGLMVGIASLLVICVAWVLAMLGE